HWSRRYKTLFLGGDNPPRPGRPRSAKEKPRLFAGRAFLRQGDGPLGPSVPAHPCLIVWKGVRTRKMRVWKFRSDHRSINSGPFLPATSSSFSGSRRLPGSKQVCSSKADADGVALVEPIRMQLA